MKRDTRAMLVDVRSAHNVGAMFRTADGAGVTKLYLAGYTPSPRDEFGRLRSDIAKTALGATETVAWEMCPDALACLQARKEEGFTIVALERAEKSIDYRRLSLGDCVVFVVGNEIDGLSKEVLREADVVASIPMRGKKESLNVATAFAIAAYQFTDD